MESDGGDTLFDAFAVFSASDCGFYFASICFPKISRGSMMVSIAIENGKNISNVKISS